jgi:hypothetical protein
MTPQEGYNAAYDYNSQRVFLEEAQQVLDALTTAYQTKDMCFHSDDVSVEKAVWMLHMDALDALRESLALLKDNRHNVASRLFRDIVETLDLASYFHSRTKQSMGALGKWYQNEVIPHKQVRQQIETTEGADAKDRKTKEYRSLSNFIHRTYMVLRNSYCLGVGDKMWFDWKLRMHGLGAIPQTVAQYLVTLGDMVRLFVCEAATCAVIPRERIRESLAGTALVRGECWGKVIPPIDNQSA